MGLFSIPHYRREVRVVESGTVEAFEKRLEYVLNATEQPGDQTRWQVIGFTADRDGYTALLGEDGA
jgi:hypothetical protein